MNNPAPNQLDEKRVELSEDDFYFIENNVVCIDFDSKSDIDISKKIKQQILENQRLRDLVEEHLTRNEKYLNCAVTPKIILQSLLDKVKYTHTFSDSANELDENQTTGVYK